MAFYAKNAIGAGIGLFIAFIGLKGAGIIVGDSSTLVTLGNLGDKASLLFIIGLVITSVLVVLNVRGGILLGMISYAFIKTISGKFREVSVAMWVLVILFVLKYIFI